MALQPSGTISLNDIHIEVGGAHASNATINDADIRGLIGKGSGATSSFNEFYNASNVQGYYPSPRNCVPWIDLDQYNQYTYPNPQWGNCSTLKYAGGTASVSMAIYQGIGGRYWVLEFQEMMTTPNETWTLGNNGWSTLTLTSSNGMYNNVFTRASCTYQDTSYQFGNSWQQREQWTSSTSQNWAWSSGGTLMNLNMDIDP